MISHIQIVNNYQQIVTQVSAICYSIHSVRREQRVACSSQYVPVQGLSPTTSRTNTIHDKEVSVEIKILILIGCGYSFGKSEIRIILFLILCKSTLIYDQSLRKSPKW